jgi:D-sedoheptulose 7-phosphate isomerase
MKSFNNEIGAYIDKLTRVIDSIDISQIDNFINLLINALHGEQQIFIMGNGGSGATASHYVCDFNKGLSWGKQKRFKLICLNDNVPTMMAYANDILYDDIFVEQMKNFFKKNDLVIGISGSGNSKNVLKAIEWSNINGGITIGLTGYNGGKLKEIAMHNAHINVDDMQITEDVHMILDHCIMKILYNYLR